VHLIGTPYDDALTGTDFGDTLLGEGGDDRLYGLGGDDLVVGGRGQDKVFGHDGDDVLLGERGEDRLYGGAGNDLLDGGSGDDLLHGEAGNDVIAGGQGADRLEGGANGDVYVYELHGGDDVIVESGGADTLQLGEGITRGMTRLERRQDDLIVDLSGLHGSVTIKGWFTSDSKKVETIQFADGTTWGVGEIRDRANRREHDGGGHRDEDHGHQHKDRDENHHGADDRRHEDQHDHSGRKDDRLADCLAAYLADKPRYDFEALTQELERSDARGEALEAREIARRWQMVDRYANALLNENDEDARGGAAHRLDDHGLLGGGAFGSAFGDTGSSGSMGGTASLKTLTGLEEGFHHLRS
jgi:hypothetical protein